MGNVEKFFCKLVEPFAGPLPGQKTVVEGTFDALSSSRAG